MTEREALTSALAGPLVNARATSAGVAPGARLQVRSGVGTSRRGDVGPLSVGDYEQTREARVLADLLERTHPVGPERLEEGDLRLHGDDVRGDRVDDSSAEAPDGLGGLLP